MGEDTLELTSRIAALAGDLEVVSKIDTLIESTSAISMGIDALSKVSTQANLSSQIGMEVV